MEGTSVETYQHIPPSINGLRVSPSVGELTAPDSHYRPVYSLLLMPKENISNLIKMFMSKVNHTNLKKREFLLPFGL